MINLFKKKFRKPMIIIFGNRFKIGFREQLDMKKQPLVAIFKSTKNRTDIIFTLGGRV